MVPFVAESNQPASRTGTSLMASPERVPLLDARPELTRFLTSPDLDEITRVNLPVVTVDEGALELYELLRKHKAFGATVLDGVVMNSLRVGEQTGIQLLGPGDLLLERGELMPLWMGEVESRAGGSVRLGLLGNELLAAAVRWPRLIQGLYAGVGDQLQRLNAQLVICQLPRVDDRVLAMLWLLSESWGQVTTSGVRLPLALTHETLGALVGARRPTVTLALRKLVQEGAIVHQDTGWLLLEAPGQPSHPTPRMLLPEVSGVTAGAWTETQSDPHPHDPSEAYAELRDTVSRLREQHLFSREEARERLNRIRSTRVHMSAVRQRIEEDALKRRRPPSA
jgi:CRP/FNR family transcriptional regulator, cyclic AMP receptor protein